MSPRISWEGVFPAVTTQFNDDLSLNIDATAKVMDGLIRDGVSGLIVCGSVGENTSLAVPLYAHDANGFRPATDREIFVNAHELLKQRFRA